MQHEKRVIDTASKITNDQNHQLLMEGLFENMSIVDIISLFANHMKNIFNELFIEHDYKHIFNQKDRKIFIGVLFIMISMCLMLVDRV